MLFLVATPIGNLADITLRAIDALKNVDYILCEDMRKSQILLKKYDIETPLKSFHKFNEKKLEGAIIQDLQAGKKVALISDAGTPGINDPGQRLVCRCRKEGLEVTSLPGATAPILALTLAGFPFEKFQFVGFLPKKPNARKKALIDAFFYPGVTVCFESPQRIYKTLEEIAKWGLEQEVAIVREMTKLHEECLRGKAKELLALEIRGEVVLVIEGHRQWEEKLSPKEHVAKLQKEYDLNKTEAIKLAAHLRGESKKEVYDCLISDENL